MRRPASGLSLLLILVLSLTTFAFIVQDEVWLTLDGTTSPLLPFLSSDPPLTADEDEDGEPAPRSHPGPYDEYVPGERYVLYSPSGGFSNQRLELEYAVEIGKMLNRTVYVPMAARHTNGWEAYNELDGPENLFPMDRVVDFPFVRTYDRRTRLVPLGTPIKKFLSDFLKKNGQNAMLAFYNPKTWGKNDVLKLRGFTQPLIMFRGPGFLHNWFSWQTMVQIRRHVRFTKYLRELAMKIAKEAFGEEGFYAIHIRMGDYAWRHEGHDSSTYLNRAREDLHWNLKARKIYVATEPGRDEKFFAPLKKEAKVMFSSELPKPLAKEFKSAFPKGKIRDDMLGVLEMLICAQAKSFLGTYYSTFSAFIKFMRDNKDVMFPEIAETVDVGEDGEGGDTMKPQAEEPVEIETR